MDRQKVKKGVVETGYKSLVVHIDPALMKDIKERALFHNMTIKAWILRAIEERRIREDKVQ